MSNVIFSIKDDYLPKDYLTISTNSKIDSDNKITYFSLGRNTDISSEKYSKNVILVINGGYGEIIINDEIKDLKTNDFIFIPKETLYGLNTSEGLIFTEIIMCEENYIMNEMIKDGEIFKLADLLSYEDDSIVNMDLISNDSLKFVIMAFDEGTSLSEHAAPGEALIFALDGEAIIGYEGQTCPIKSGENFKFNKGGLHSIEATGKFKMALLLTFD
ncbi:MAG: cupin domain-containing protein [Methanosphaera stadtmanae]|nr:cupin domain-containing protein [Methanosphaera stadtmanae]